MAKLINNFSGEAIDGCYATTCNSSSSYGIPVWADNEGNAYVQVGENPFYSVEFDTDRCRIDIGEVINGRRQDLGLTIEWLASASGVDSDCISRVENGESSDIDTILKLLSSLGCKFKISTVNGEDM